MRPNTIRARIWIACIAVMCGAPVGTDAFAQRPMAPPTTIEHGETLLVGAVDFTLVPVDGADKRFFLLKHHLRYWPFENENVQLEQVPGFRNKWFFFVKVDSWDAAQASHTLTLRFERPDNRMMYITTFPLISRVCEGNAKMRHCTGGITSVGLFTLNAQRTETEDGPGWEYSFTATADDPDLRAAFERRYNLEHYTPDGDTLGSKYLRISRRER